MSRQDYFRQRSRGFCKSQCVTMPNVVYTVGRRECLRVQSLEM